MLLAILIVLVWTAVMLVLFIGTFATWLMLRLRTLPVVRDEPVSILKPVRGTDPYLETCLRSFMKMRMIPGDEIIFCVEERDDWACLAIRRVIAQYPKVRARLVIEQDMPDDMRIGCVNPKIRTLHPAYEGIMNPRQDLVLISDSNVLADPDYLTHLASDYRGGMLTSIVRGSMPHGMAGYIEQAYMNAFLARWLVVTHVFNRPCVLGKSMLFSRNDMAVFGGLKVLGAHMAEDYNAALLYHYTGRSVGIASRPVTQVIGHYRMSDFWKRHVRWSRLRKYQTWPFYLIEPMSQMLTLGALAALGVDELFGPTWAWGFLAAHVLTWFAADYIVMRAVGDRMTIPLFFGWLFRECLAPALWVHGLCGSTVNWRGRIYRLKWGGTAERV